MEMSSTVAVKRKRGRPRRDEAVEINQFDISLINEFAQRPAFYDRSCVHYRNRDYLDLQWEEMGQILGYSVSFIKDRIMQLRNRYNLEKRRVETLQEQYNDPDIVSQWPLFDYMNFLGDHIKSRRSNKSLSNVQIKHAGHNSSLSNDPEEYDESRNCSSDDSGSEKHFYRMKNRKNMDPLDTGSKDADGTGSHNRSTFGGLRNRAGDVLNRTQYITEIHQSTHNPASLRRSQQQHLSDEKFRAFGQFLAASLSEMNEIEALRLVDKFTSEVVKSVCVTLKASTGQENNVEAASA